MKYYFKKIAAFIIVFFSLLIINSFLFIPSVYSQEWGNDPLDIMSPSSSSDSLRTPVSQQSLAINLAQAPSELLDKVKDGDVAALNQLGDELVGNTLTTAEKQQVIYELTQIAKRSGTNSNIKPEIAKLLVNIAESKDRNGNAVVIDEKKNKEEYAAWLEVRKSAITSLYTVVKSVNIGVDKKEGIVNSLTGIIQTDLNAEIKETAVDTMVNILMKDVGLGSSVKESAILGLLAAMKDKGLSDGIKEKTLSALGRLAKGSKISAETKEKMLVALVGIIADESISISVRETALLTAVRIIKSPSFYAEATAIDSLLDIAQDKTKRDETRELVISGLATIVRSSDVDIGQREGIVQRLLFIAQDTNDEINVRESAFLALPLARLARSSAIKAFPTKSLMLDYLSTIAQDTAFSDTARAMAVGVIGILIRDPNNAAKLDNQGKEIANTGILLSRKISVVESLLENIAKNENESDDLRLAVLSVSKRIARSVSVDVSLKERMIQPLLEILNDGNSNEGVRIASISVLAAAVKNRNIAESTRQTVITALVNTAQNGSTADRIRINSLSAISSIISKDFVGPEVKERLAVSLLDIAKDNASGTGVRKYALDVLTNIAGDSKVNSTVKEGMVQVLLDIAVDESLKPADSTKPDIRENALRALARIADDANVSAGVKETIAPVALELAVKKEAANTNLEIRKDALAVLDNIARDDEVSSAVKQAMIAPLEETVKDSSLKPETDADGNDKTPDIRKIALSVLGTIVKDSKLKILDTAGQDITVTVQQDILDFILNDVAVNAGFDDAIRKDAIVVLNTIAKEVGVQHTLKESLLQPLLNVAKGNSTLAIRDSALLVLETIVKDEKVDTLKKEALITDLLAIANNSGLEPAEDSKDPDIRKKALSILGVLTKDEKISTNKKKEIAESLFNLIKNFEKKTDAKGVVQYKLAHYIRAAALEVLIDAAVYASDAVRQAMVETAGADNDLMDIANNTMLDETSIRKAALLVISNIIDSAAVSKATKEKIVDSLKNMAYNDDLNFGTRAAALLVIGAIAGDGSATSVDAAFKTKLIEYLEELVNDGNIELWRGPVDLDTWPAQGVNLIHQADGSDWLVYNEIDVVVNGVYVKVKNGVKKETWTDPKDNKTKTRLVLYGVLSDKDKDDLTKMIASVEASADNTDEMKADFETAINGIITRSESFQSSAVDLRRHAAAAVGFILRGADITNRQMIIVFLQNKILNDQEEEVAKSALIAFGDVITDVNLNDNVLKLQMVEILLTFANEKGYEGVSSSSDESKTANIKTTALSALADAAKDPEVDAGIKEAMITGNTNIMTVIENTTLSVSVRKSALSVLDNIFTDMDVAISTKFDMADNLFTLVKSTEAAAELKNSALTVIGSLFNATLQSSAPLDNLPADIVFPDSVKEKITYDVNKKMLIFRGFMTDAEKTSLKELSADQGYQNAIDALYNATADKYTKANSIIDGLFGVVFDGGVQTDVKNGAVKILRTIAMDTSVGISIKERLIDKAGASNDLKDIADNTSFAEGQTYIRINALAILREIIRDKDIGVAKKQDIITFLLDKVKNDTNISMKKVGLGLVEDIVSDGSVEASLKEGMISSLLGIAGSGAVVDIRAQALQVLGGIARDTNVSEAAKKDLADNGLTAIFNDSGNDLNVRKTALWVLGDIAMAGNITDNAIKESVVNKLIAWAKDTTLAVDLRKTALWVLDAIIRSGSLTTSSVALDTLPLQGVLDSITDPDLKAKISYDASRKVLIFEGAMTDAEKAALKELSADPAWQNAIDALYVSSNTTLQTTAPLESIPVPNMFNYPDSVVYSRNLGPANIFFTTTHADGTVWMIRWDPVTATTRMDNKIQIMGGGATDYIFILRDVLTEQDKSDLLANLADVKASSNTDEVKAAFEKATMDLINYGQYYLPSSVKAKISYNSSTKQVVFKGVMSAADKEALKKLLPNNYEYQSAIDALYAASNADAVIESYTTLAQLPEDISSLIVTSEGKAWIVKDKLEVFLDSNSSTNPTILRFTGVMSEADRNYLKALSTDAAWQGAVDKLYALSNTVPYTSAPLDTLPAGLTLPANVTYDAASKRITFKGVMTDAERISLKGLSSDTAYQNAIDALYALSNADTEISAPLDSIPGGTTFPESLNDKISYDADKKQLIFKGIMTETDLAALLALSTGNTEADTLYKQAINDLYTKNKQDGETQVFINNNIVTSLFDIANNAALDNDTRELAVWVLGSVARDKNVSTATKEGMADPVTNMVKDTKLDMGIRKAALWVLGDVTMSASDAKKQELVGRIKDIITASSGDLGVDLRKTALWVLGNIILEDNTLKDDNKVGLMDFLSVAVVDDLSVDIQIRESALWVLGRIGRLGSETAPVTSTGRNIKMEAVYKLLYTYARGGGEIRKTAARVLGSIVRDVYVSDAIKRTILWDSQQTLQTLPLTYIVGYPSDEAVVVIEVLGGIVKDPNVDSALRLELLGPPDNSNDLYTFAKYGAFDSAVAKKAVEILVDIIRTPGCYFTKEYTNPSDETPGDGEDDTIILNISGAVKKGDKIIIDDKGTPDEGDDTVDNTFVNNGILDTLFWVMKNDPDADVRQAVKTGLYAILDDPLGDDAAKQKIIEFLNANPGL